MAELLGNVLASILERQKPNSFEFSAENWSRGSDRMRRCAAKILLEATAESEDTFHRLKYSCESPIECLALAGLVVLFPTGSFVKSLDDLRKLNDWAIAVIPQLPRHGYRLDFGVINRAMKVCFDLECDGKDWHYDKPKDNRRDANLWEKGVVAYHVTGSELVSNWRNALVPFQQKVFAR